jgi:hypothetical protein
MSKEECRLVHATEPIAARPRAFQTDRELATFPWAVASFLKPPVVTTHSRSNPMRSLSVALLLTSLAWSSTVRADAFPFKPSHQSVMKSDFISYMKSSKMQRGPLFGYGVKVLTATTPMPTKDNGWSPHFKAQVKFGNAVYEREYFVSGPSIWAAQNGQWQQVSSAQRTPPRTVFGKLADLLVYGPGR